MLIDRRRPGPVVISCLVLALAGLLPAQKRLGMVVSQHDLASALGAQVIEDGGNAVDAAIATAFALAVTHPEAGNIGGGGFLVLRRPDGFATTIDFRECAPMAAHERMFLDETGGYDRAAHHDSALSVGVPGTVAGLWLAHARYGRLPWRRLVAPAVSLARDGFPVDEGLAASIEKAREKIERWPETRRIFLPEGAPPAVGSVLRQPELAAGLERILLRGAEGFYGGKTAELLTRGLAAEGGVIEKADLTGYRAIERPPLVGRYRGHEIITMGPPSSGGATLTLMLGMLEAWPVEREPVPRIHLLAEIMRRAFAERARYLGDPESVDEEGLARMLDPEHAKALAATIDMSRASVSSADEIGVQRGEGDHTTHISVVDAELGMAALTYTIEEAWGSGIVLPGLGFVLNNEMGDFNPVPGRTDEDGHIGTPPNLVAPGRRMLSSMSPTLVLDARGRPYLVLGSPGGRTIINTVFLLVTGVVDLGWGMQPAVAAPRWHHGFLPDRIVLEEALAEAVDIEALRALGHELRIVPRIGAAECIRITYRRDEPVF